MSNADGLQFSMSVTVTKDRVAEYVREYLTREIATSVESTVASYEVKRKLVPELVKEMVYAHKDEIIEQIVSRATTELVRKGLPKLLERMDEI